MGKWLGLADEVTFGTPVTPPTYFVDCLSIGVSSSTEVATAESSNFPGAIGKAVGGYKAGGEIEITPNSENIAKLLKWLLGSPTSTQDGANPRWKHVYIPSDTLKFGTMYKVDESQPDGSNVFQFISNIVTELRLEAALNSYLSARFTLLGQKDAKVAKPTVGTFSTIKQFFSLEGKMYWDISKTLEETYIRAVSLTYRREVPDDFMSMNDRFLKAFIPGPGSLEGSVDLLFKNWTAQEKFWGGTSGPVSGQPANAQMTFDFLGPSLGGTGEYTNHRLMLKLPALVIPSVEAPYEGRDAVIQTVNFEGLRGALNGTTSLLELTLVNSLAGSSV